MELLALPEANTVLARQAGRRNLVLDAAAEAFCERGFAATSINDVARRLGCNKGHVYHYFRTKGELFLGVHHRPHEMSLAAVEPSMCAKESASVRLHRMAHAHARLMLEQTAYMRLSVQYAEVALALEGGAPSKALVGVLQLRQQYEGYFQTVIADGIRDGEFCPGNPRLLTLSCLGALNWMSVWHRAGRGRDSQSESNEEIAVAFADFVTHGLLDSERVSGAALADVIDPRATG